MLKVYKVWETPIVLEFKKELKINLKIEEVWENIPKVERVCESMRKFENVLENMSE